MTRHVKGERKNKTLCLHLNYIRYEINQRSVNVDKKLQVTSERFERTDLSVRRNMVRSTPEPKQFTLTGETVCLCAWVDVYM